MPESENSKKCDTSHQFQNNNLTPTKKSKQAHYHDRFITTRTSRDLSAAFNLHDEAAPSTPIKRKLATTEGECQKEEVNKTYTEVLKLEMFGTPNGKFRKDSRFKCQTLLQYSSPRKQITPKKDSPHSSTYSLSPLGLETQRLLQSPRRVQRYISKVPCRVLDAPELQDDFYLNLIDWSSTNILGVGLSTCVYLWSACTNKVTKLCDLGPYDSVTSVNWMERGTHVAVGTNRGLVQIYDVQRCRKVRTMSGHQARVGTLAWNDHLLTSGGRDRLIIHRDVRIPGNFVRILTGHKQEVCGLKWNPEHTFLASGGNDNNLFVWDKTSETPILKFTDHSAAVKAISWSPHQHGLLASGGGTADRKIRFWNTLTGSCLNTIDTGSQVCNLAWSKTVNEIVSTHGYSQNQIVVWRYPTMSQIATLTGHTFRVLYLTMSPDGQTIVTGAGDETLRFWNVFSKGNSIPSSSTSLSSSALHIR